MWTRTTRIPTIRIIRTIIESRHRLLRTTATTTGSHLAEAMRAQKISKNKMGDLLKTSRSPVDRLLDPSGDIKLMTLQRVAGFD